MKMIDNKIDNKTEEITVERAYSLLECIAIELTGALASVDDIHARVYDEYIQAIDKAQEVLVEKMMDKTEDGKS